LSYASESGYYKLIYRANQEKNITSFIFWANQGHLRIWITNFFGVFDL